MGSAPPLAAAATSPGLVDVDGVGEDPHEIDQADAVGGVGDLGAVVGGDDPVEAGETPGDRRHHVGVTDAGGDLVEELLQRLGLAAVERVGVVELGLR